LVARLHRGDRWDVIFNIAEGRHGFGREAQVPALLDAYQIPYTFSDPLVSALTLHKGMTKHLLRDMGLPTAPWAIVAEPNEAAGVQLEFPLLGKPVAEGTSKGIGSDAVARDPGQLRALCERLLATYRQPVLVESFLPGRELTVGLVGTGAAAWSLGALEDTLLAGADAEVCTFRNKEQCESLVRYQRVDDDDARAAAALALRAWRGLGCRDAGRVDVRADAEGRPSFIEVNPLAGLRPGVGDLPIMCNMAGMPFRDLIGAIIDSARLRVARRS
jgi:D-alanine-D-alanine ligase